MVILLTPDETATLLGLTPAALRALRREHCGPCFLAITPRTIRYRLSDVAIWATLLSSRASVGCATAYDAAMKGEDDIETLRQIAQDAAAAAEVKFDTELQTTLASVQRGSRTIQ